MKYTSCFIGIPLPIEFHRQFTEVATQIKLIIPGIKLVDLDTPHITIYYLSAQSQDNLGEVAKRAEGLKHLLNNSRLSVGGMGLFSPAEPRVLFMDVVFEPSLANFNKRISRLLNEYYAMSNNLTFHPHVSLAKISIELQDKFVEQKEKVEVLLSEVDWMFEISGISIYGVDSKVQPEKQSRLIDIKL